MPVYKKSIHRSLIRGVTEFIALLCLLLSLQSYMMISRPLYARYNDFLSDILLYVEHNTDADDLRECIRTGVPSEKYAELQSFLNGMIDDFQLYYLYICIPVDDEVGTMINVCSATSAAERAAGETDIALLHTSVAYPRDELEEFLAAWERDTVSCFEERSDFGYAYTACKPLKTSDGETIALICADLQIDELRGSICYYVTSTVILAVVTGALFGMVTFLWIRRDVTGPVVALEKRARQFAEKSHGKKDPDQLIFDAPDIRTQNEVESLSDAITQMSKDMKTYVEDILLAEERAKSAEREAEGMSRLAYQDALTHMKSKAAYDVKAAELERQIACRQARFAIVMVDLNSLKKINDTFGHDAGNKYIIGSCGIIGDVYKHSPIYRVGGDEFVVVLQGRDYDRRGELLDMLKDRFRSAGAVPEREPWERYSAAVGMAEYSAAGHDTVKQVFRRADERMYENKKEMKMARADG